MALRISGMEIDYLLQSCFRFLFTYIFPSIMLSIFIVAFIAAAV